MKTFLFRSMIGIFFGAFLAVIVTNSIIYFGKQEVLDGQIFMKNSLGSIFCGWFFTVSPLYFENTKLRLSQQTALHFATVVVVVLHTCVWNWVGSVYLEKFSSYVSHRSLSST